VKQTDGDDCPDPDEYLMRADYALDGEPGCVADARDHAAAFLDRAGDHHLRLSPRAKDDTALVVSELVTNACRYAPGPLLMELGLRVGALEITVWDTDPRIPAALPADPRRIGRHGLEIVEAVAEDLSVERVPVGKRVTARIALADAP
jgi:anti-sigma regulatory factor (Ser/Thr protein kinase)